MALAMASAWPSGKSESLWPWVMRVGTLIRSATADGLRASSSSRARASGFPATATRSYISHSAFSNRPHPEDCDGTAFSSPIPVVVEPVVKKIPAQSFLKTSSGKRESARFQ